MLSLSFPVFLVAFISFVLVQCQSSTNVTNAPVHSSDFGLFETTPTISRDTLNAVFDALFISLVDDNSRAVDTGKSIRLCLKRAFARFCFIPEQF